ncbi:hypothetical protein B0H13DRAFT_2383258 [Mycena leptocephala]|nr:hypothetical protein B0H13DRAFT_2383258 [Mycena leptocephala]
MAFVSSPATHTSPFALSDLSQIPPLAVTATEFLDGLQQEDEIGVITKSSITHGVRSPVHLHLIISRALCTGDVVLRLRGKTVRSSAMKWKVSTEGKAGGREVSLLIAFPLRESRCCTPAGVISVLPRTRGWRATDGSGTVSSYDDENPPSRRKRMGGDRAPRAQRVLIVLAALRVRQHGRRERRLWILGAVFDVESLR